MNSNVSATSVSVNPRNEYQTLSEHQLAAIARYAQNLDAIDDPIVLRKKALDLYTQSLRTHNTYLAMETYKDRMEVAYQYNSVTADIC